MGRDDLPPSSSLPIHLRIRRRREDRGINGVELAERAGVSPSYVSLIEKGVKIPDEEVAVAIARVLGDDEELYRSWARAKRYGDDLETASADLVRAYQYSSDRKLRQRISSGGDVSEALGDETARAARRPRRPLDFAKRLFAREEAPVRESPHPAYGALIEVPVVSAGSDPGDGPGTPPELSGSSLRIDANLVDSARLAAPFAFRADPQTIGAMADEIHPGDWVVVDRGVQSVDPDTIYAVRVRGGLVLSRVWIKAGAILLPPAPRSRDVEVLELAEGESPSRYLVGRVVAVVRARI